MPTDAPCPKCGSHDIVPEARVIDRGHMNDQSKEMRVGVARKPEAWLFKQEERSDLFARICGGCGFAELYVREPRAIYDAYRAARQGG
jgi:predicted nucleic-acid-binding Zn-ribbon protein